MERRVACTLLISGLLAPLLPAQNTSADDRIYDEVRRRLANDRDVKGAGIEVTVMNGVVKLVGRVSSDKARLKAAEITKKVKGVTSVDNQLKVFGLD